MQYRIDFYMTLSLMYSLLLERYRSLLFLYTLLYKEDSITNINMLS